MTGLCGVILAAGESTRMGRDKALLPWPKDSPSGTLLSSAIRAFSAQCELTLVVGGNNAERIAPVVYAEGAFMVRNPAPERGQFSSLQTGLHEILNRGRDNALVTLVDVPAVRQETLLALISAFSQRSHDIWAVIPEYEGRHGHPIAIGREMMEAFLAASATANARDIRNAQRQHLAFLKVDDPAVIRDVDTPQEYSGLQPED